MKPRVPNKLAIIVGGTMILGLLLSSCGGAAPTAISTPTIEPTATIIPTAIPDLRATISAAVQATTAALPTPTPPPTSMVEPTHEGMVMDPTPTHEGMVMDPTPTHEGMTMDPTPTLERTMSPTPPPEDLEKFSGQEVAVIEVGNRFWPDPLVVVKGIPSKLYLSRTHAEHINSFVIASEYFTDVILPGQIGEMEFMLDEAGEFKIVNAGHGWEGDLVAVETAEEAKKFRKEKGIQEFALLHSLDEFRIVPDRLVVQKGVPVKIYNIAMKFEHRVSIEPFYVPEDINVKQRFNTTIEFTPDKTGEFTILHEIHGIMGTLVVEEGE